MQGKYHCIINQKKEIKMNYKAVNTYEEFVEINNCFYKVMVDFSKEIGFINWKEGKIKFNLDEYTEFDGNMEAFVLLKLS